MFKRKILNIGSTPDPNCEALKDALKIKTIDEINKDIAKKDAEITKLNNQIKAAGCK